METTLDTSYDTNRYAYFVSFGNAFKKFFSNYMQFEGRSNRGDFWKAGLCLFVVSLILTVVDGALSGNGGVPFLGMIFSLVTLIPGIAISVRRLHDIGKSGWWYLLIFIPIVGAIILLVWFCTRPDPVANQFG